MAIIKIPAVKSTEVTSKVTYEDGIVIYVTGANNATTRKPLYLEAYAKAHSTSTPPVEIPPIVTPPPTSYYYQVTPVSGKTLDLGNLKDNVVLAKGTYSNVYMTWKSANDVIVDCTGVTFINSTVEVGAGNNVKLVGLTLKDNPYRPLRFDFKLNNFELNGLNFINCGDYIITSNGAGDTTYNGTDSTLNKSFKIVGCTFDGSGAVSLGGDLNESKDTGLFKDVEIAKNVFKNSSPGSAVSMTNVWNYSIHDNVVDSFNADSNTHNGIFFMQGNGVFYNNKLTNYQGNAIRMWVYSRGNVPALVMAYNNIMVGTRKYGGIEIQEFARNIVKGKSTFVNAQVYNNTAGDLDSSKEWEGQLLDLYNFGGVLRYENNLGFNLVSTKPPITDMINNMSSVKVTLSSNVYTTKDKAVDSKLNSKIAGVGASL